MKYLRQIYSIIKRENYYLKYNPMYFFCIVVAPVVVILFFTTLMKDGQPVDLPVGIVDADNTSTTRALVRNLDAFQNSEVVAHYPTVGEARRAIQENEISGFLYLPKGTTDQLLASRQPKISFYYSLASITGGSLVFKDLKTVSTLGAAAVGQATMRARGFTDQQIQTLLQPIRIDLHQIANPWTNYNLYLSTMIVPGILMLFMFLITVYSLGTELKFGSSKEWLALADNRIGIALLGKLLPQTLMWLTIVFIYEYYVFGILRFPHQGGAPMLVLLALLHVAAAQGFGIFAFGLMPSLRMSMSICSLWGMLSFSLAGSAFPIMAMDGPIQALSWLFPLRHYFMIYQACVFNGFPLLEVWFHFVALCAFALLPWLVSKKIKNAMLTYVYIP